MTKRRGPRNDPQQTAVYTWEDSFTKWPGPHLDEKEMRELVGRACAKYRVPVPYLVFARRDKEKGKYAPSSYWPDLHKIKFRPRHMNAAIALHESAHAITDYILGASTGLEPHGEQWLGVYMVLLEDFGIMPRVGLHALADAAKLKYQSRDRVGPVTIRKRNRTRVRRAKAYRRWSDTKT